MCILKLKKEVRALCELKDKVMILDNMQSGIYNPLRVTLLHSDPNLHYLVYLKIDAIDGGKDIVVFNEASGVSKGKLIDMGEYVLKIIDDKNVVALVPGNIECIKLLLSIKSGGCTNVAVAVKEINKYHAAWVKFISKSKFLNRGD